MSAAFNVHAFQVSSLSPQGEVAQVRQLVVNFDEAAVNFGDPKAAAPLTVSCSDEAHLQGSGRWVNEREWAFEFSRDLPPGLRCEVKLAAALQSVKGAKLSGAGSYQFNTGGPFVTNMLPSYGAINTNIFHRPAQWPRHPSQRAGQYVVSVDGLGERVPVKLIDGKERADLLNHKALKNLQRPSLCAL